MVTGSTGALRFDELSGSVNGEPAVPGRDPLVLQCEHLVACARGEADSWFGFEEGRAVTEVLMRAERAMVPARASDPRPRTRATGPLGGVPSFDGS